MPDDAGVFDVSERYYEPDEQLRQNREMHQASIRVAAPVIAESHDTKGNTVDGNVATKSAILQPDGTVSWQAIPKLTMPTLYLGGGGMAITIPVQKGDEGLAIFADRSIDLWHQQGGQQNQFSSRMHDLSDGFFIPGFRSTPNALPNVSANSWQMRTTDGKTNMDFNPSGGGTFTFATPQNPLAVNGKGFNTDTENNTLKASGTNTLNSPNTHITGDTKADGKIDASGGFFQNGQPIGGGGGGGGGGSGTVTSITAGTGLTGGTITTSGTIALAIPVTIANGGTNATTAAQALINLGALPLAGGTITGNLTVQGTTALGQATGVTMTTGDSSTHFATTAWVKNQGYGIAQVAMGTVPPVAGPGTLWWDTNGGQLYVRFDDGNSVQWVIANTAPKGDKGDTGPAGPPGSGGGGGGIPEAPQDGFGYGRQNAAWTQVIMANNDVIDGGNF